MPVTTTAATVADDPRRPWRKRIISVVAHVVLIAASILMLYPLLWMLAASFRPEREIFSSTSLIPSGSCVSRAIND